MKCDELKKRLADKDQEVKAIKDNTIAIFNEVKDLIVDDLIQACIDDKFEGGNYVSSRSVYDLILDNAGIDHSYLHLDISIFNRDCILDCPNFRSIFAYNFDLSELLRESRMEASQQYINVSDFFKTFDYEFLASLLDNYILSKGFKRLIINNIWDQKVKTRRFTITRSQLENQCCSTKPVIRDEELNPDSSKALLGLLILFSVIIAIIAILK